MAYKFQLGAFTASGSLTQEGAIECDTSLTIGTAAMTEADLEKLDGITNGAAAANKALVADSNVDITGLRNVTGTGAITAGTSFIIGSADLNETDLEKLDGITNGTAAASKAVVLDASKNIATIGTVGCGAITSTGASSMGSLNVGGTLACDTSFTLDSVVINATEIGYLDAVTAGTAAASKALVLDANGKIATITQLTASYISGVAGQFTELSVAANSLTIGDTVLSEGELGVLDGFTDTAIAAGADSIVFYDVTNNKLRRDLLSDYATAIAGDGLGASAGVLAVKVGTNKGLALTSDALEITASALAAAAVAPGADSFLLFDSDGSAKVESFADYATNIASTGISAAAGALSITPAQTAITSVLNDALKLGRGDGNDYVDFGSDAVINFGIDNSVVAKINAGAISGSAGLQAGGNITLHGNIDVDAAQALTIGATVGANNLTLGAASSTVVVAGNLTVSGTTTTVSSTTIEITGSFLFDGTTPGGNKTTLAVVNPTADRTINLADSAGTLVPFATPPAAAMQLTVTPTELNIMDGDATINAGVAIADGDGFVLNDGGSMKQIQASTVKSYAKRQVVAVLDNTGTGSVGFNYFASLAGAEECALPASPTVGDIVYIKAADNCSTTNTITINGLGSHTIDGQSAVVLESPNAALGFLYAVANEWRIF
jgi:hypothetical protein